MSDDGLWEVLPFDGGTFTSLEDGPNRGDVGVVVAHALRTRDGSVFLFDTGLAAGDPELDARFKIDEQPLEAALGEVGIELTSVVAAANCHLHPDHAGHNRALANIAPIYVQAAEQRLASRPGHTVRAFVEGPGVQYVEIDGDRDVAPGIRIVRTPGHTAGHQSLLVMTRRGRVLLAGQAIYTLDEWLGRPGRNGRAHATDAEEYGRTAARLRALPISSAYFAHDRRTWDAGPSDAPGMVEG